MPVNGCVDRVIERQVAGAAALSGNSAAGHPAKEASGPLLIASDVIVAALLRPGAGDETKQCQYDGDRRDSSHSLSFFKYHRLLPRTSVAFRRISTAGYQVVVLQPNHCWH